MSELADVTPVTSASLDPPPESVGSTQEASSVTEAVSSDLTVQSSTDSNDSSNENEMKPIPGRSPDNGELGAQLPSEQLTPLPTPFLPPLDASSSSASASGNTLPDMSLPKATNEGKVVELSLPPMSPLVVPPPSVETLANKRTLRRASAKVPDTSYVSSMQSPTHDSSQLGSPSQPPQASLARRGSVPLSRPLLASSASSSLSNDPHSQPFSGPFRLNSLHSPSPSSLTSTVLSSSSDHQVTATPSKPSPTPAIGTQLAGNPSSISGDFSNNNTNNNAKASKDIVTKARSMKDIEAEMAVFGEEIAKFRKGQLAQRSVPWLYDELQKLFSKAEGMLTSLVADVNCLTKDKDFGKRQVNTLTKEISMMKTSLSEKDEALKQLEEKHAVSLEQEKEKQSELAQELAKVRGEMADRDSASRKKLEEMKVDWQTQIVVLTKASEEKDAEIQLLTERIDALSSDLKGERSSVVEEKKIIKTLQDQLADRNSDIDHLDNKLKSVMSELYEAKATIQELKPWELKYYGLHDRTRKDEELLLKRLQDARVEGGALRTINKHMLKTAFATFVRLRTAICSTHSRLSGLYLATCSEVEKFRQLDKPGCTPLTDAAPVPPSGPAPLSARFVDVKGPEWRNALITAVERKRKKLRESLTGMKKYNLMQLIEALDSEIASFAEPLASLISRAWTLHGTCDSLTTGAVELTRGNKDAAVTIESLSSRLKETETQLADAILQRDRERQAKDDRTKHLHTLTKELAQANKSLRQVHLVETFIKEQQKAISIADLVASTKQTIKHLRDEQQRLHDALEGVTASKAKSNAERMRLAGGSSISKSNSRSQLGRGHMNQGESAGDNGSTYVGHDQQISDTEGIGRVDSPGRERSGVSTPDWGDDDSHIPPRLRTEILATMTQCAASSANSSHASARRRYKTRKPPLATQSLPPLVKDGDVKSNSSQDSSRALAPPRRIDNVNDLRDGNSLGDGNGSSSRASTCSEPNSSSATSSGTLVTDADPNTLSWGQQYPSYPYSHAHSLEHHQQRGLAASTQSTSSAIATDPPLDIPPPISGNTRNFNHSYPSSKPQGFMPIDRPARHPPTHRSEAIWSPSLRMHLVEAVYSKPIGPTSTHYHPQQPNHIRRKAQGTRGQSVPSHIATDPESRRAATTSPPKSLGDDQRSHSARTVELRKLVAQDVLNNGISSSTRSTITNQDVSAHPSADQTQLHRDNQDPT